MNMDEQKKKLLNEADLLAMVGKLLSRWKFISVVTFCAAIFGVVTLAMQNIRAKGWLRAKSIVSFVLSVIIILLFTLTLQPYAAVFAFVLLLVKALLLIKWN